MMSIGADSYKEKGIREKKGYGIKKKLKSAGMVSKNLSGLVTFAQRLE